MSIPIPIPELPATTNDYDFAYVLTVTADSRARAVAVRPSWVGSELRFELGTSSRANASERPQLTLVYPPVEAGGSSLIVDGIATVGADAVVFTPTSAVLHRPA